MTPRPVYRNRPPKKGPKRKGFVGWIDTMIVWSQGIGHPVMLFGGIVGFIVATVFIVGLGQMVYEWVLTQRPGAAEEQITRTLLEQSTGIGTGAGTGMAPGLDPSAMSDEQLARALLEQSGGASTGDLGSASTGVGSLSGVVNYESLQERRYVPCSGSDVYVLEEALPDYLLQPGQLLPSGDNLIALQGGYLPLPIAHGTVDGSGRYSISGIPAGEYFVYCHNANYEDTIPDDPYRGDEWRVEPYVMIGPGQEASVDFRF